MPLDLEAVLRQMVQERASDLFLAEGSNDGAAAVAVAGAGGVAPAPGVVSAGGVGDSGCGGVVVVAMSGL